MDTRFRTPERKKQVVLTWARREYSNLLRAYKASVAVPMPIAIRENIVIMEFLGNQGNLPNPLPLMKDAVDDENAPRVYKQFIEEVRKLYRAGLVHGDLSEFNVLMDGEKPILIDLSHAITTIAPAASDLLDRDVDNIVRFFKKKGLKLDAEEVKRYIKG
jgi:RIO kinase 1